MSFDNIFLIACDKCCRKHTASFQVSDSKFVDLPWTNTTTYMKESIITVSIKLYTNHGGRFSLSVCDSKKPGDLTIECFRKNPPLVSMDSRLRKYWIPDNSPEYNLQWRLPKGFVCTSGCVLMFEYYAMQTCIEPCKCANCGGYCKGTNPLNPWSTLKFCTDTIQPQKLEIFRNCADITITAWIAVHCKHATHTKTFLV